jgi:hypothetical protein
VGLVHPFVAVNFNDLSGYDVVSGTTGTRTGTITSDIRFPGIGCKSTDATTSRYDYGSQTTTQTKFTACAVFIFDGGTNNIIVCNSDSNSGFRLEYGSGAGIRISKGGVTNLANIALTNGIPYAVVASHEQTAGDYYLLLKNLNTGAITVATQTSTTVSTAGTGAVGVAGGRVTGGSYSWSGTIFMAVAAFEYLPRSLGEAWLQNPWAIFQSPPRYIFAEETALTLALTGVASTTSVGTVALEESFSVTGVSETSSVGTIALTRDAATTGVSETSAVGTFGDNLDVAVIGNETVGNVGTLTATDSGSTVAITNVLETGSVGTFVSGSSEVLSGLESVHGIGSVTKESSASLSGASASSANGNLVPEQASAISGVLEASDVGTVTYTTPRTLALEGISISGSIGTITQSGADVIISHGGGVSGVTGKFKKRPPEPFDQSYLNRIFDKDSNQIRQAINEIDVNLIKNKQVFEQAVREIKKALEVLIKTSQTNMALALFKVRERQIIENIIIEKVIQIKKKRKKEEDLMIEFLKGLI